MVGRAAGVEKRRGGPQRGRALAGLLLGLGALGAAPAAAEPLPPFSGQLPVVAPGTVAELAALRVQLEQALAASMAERGRLAAALAQLSWQQQALRAGQPIVEQRVQAATAKLAAGLNRQTAVERELQAERRRLTAATAARAEAQARQQSLAAAVLRQPEERQAMLAEIAAAEQALAARQAELAAARAAAGTTARAAAAVRRDRQQLCSRTATDLRQVLLDRPVVAAEPALLDFDRLDALYVAYRTGAAADPTAPAQAPTVVEPASMDLPARRHLQRALLLLGLYDGLIDGRFGGRTSSAIRAFQGQLGSAATGKLTAADYRKLLDQAEDLRQEFAVQTFRDPELGYRFDYPSALLGSSWLAAPTMRRWADEAGLAALDAKVTPLRAAPLAALFEQVRGADATSLERLSEAGFVVAGTSGGRRFIHLAKQRGQSRVVQLRLEYPAEESALWQRFTGLLASSFAVDG